MLVSGSVVFSGSTGEQMLQSCDQVEDSIMLNAVHRVRGEMTMYGIWQVQICPSFLTAAKLLLISAKQMERVKLNN